MKDHLGAALVAAHLLLVSSFAFSQEAPVVVIKDSEGRYAQANKQNIAKLAELIEKNGSVVVWITLDPDYVDFSPGLTGISDKRRAAQETRTARELDRIVRPLIAARKAGLVSTTSKTQFGTSGMLRISHELALNHILSSPAVSLVTLAGL